VGEFGEGCREPMPWAGLHAEFVVAAAEVLDERVSGTDTRAERNRFRPRIDRSRAFRHP